MKITKDKFFDILKVIIWPAIALLLFFCFEEKITDLLEKFSNTWLSKCDELSGGIAIMVLALLVVARLILKDIKSRLSLNHVLWLVCLIVVYIHYRCGDVFRFWGFSGVAYSDFFGFPIVTILIVQIALLCERKNTNNGNCILDKDEPIEDDEEDAFGYGSIINEILSDLKMMDLSKRSYSIGIEGEWGMGKSSFFNLFKQRLEKDEKDSIVVTFNPRSSAKLDDIQNDFFNKFAEALEPYHYGISRDMSRYQDALQLPEDNFVLRLLRLLPSLTTSRGKGTINQIISSINKRIYVFVDDFDRLTAKEILEVMKVIDRNGDFRQTIFLTAYDKEYVNEVLRNYLKHGKKDAYSDKYFNYEIHLPLQSREELSKYVRKSLSEKLQDDPKNAITVEQMQKEWDDLAGIVVPQLNTLRHVKRFMNIFLSRYGRVRNDVVFEDFIRVTLLRYFDIKTYHALVEGKLTKGGGLLNNSTDKVLYQADDLEERIKQYSQWNGSLQILTELFDKGRDNDYELPSKYKRVRWRDSFACYFYDYQPDGMYYKDLMKLYDASNEEEAIKELHILLKYDANKNTVDRGRYVAIENFLRSRPIRELRNSEDVVRLFDLFCYINQFMGRSINIDASIAYMIGKDAELELNDLCGGDYKGVINEAIRHIIEVRPLSVAFILLQYNQEMLKPNTNVSEYLFSQGEIQGFAEWCQKCYFLQIKSINSHNVEAVINLSRVKENVNGKTIISKAANDEFVSFITYHADEFVKSAIHVIKTQTEHPEIMVDLVGSFNPDEFFPNNGVSFSYWMSNEVNNVYTSNLFERVLKEDEKQIRLSLSEADCEININDYERIYRLVKADDEKKEEIRVMEAINKNVANSIELLSQQTSLPKDIVRETIKRLKNKGELVGNRTNIANVIPAFEIGDFVRIKDSERNKYKDKQNAVHMHDWNLFEIHSKDGDVCKLVDFDADVPCHDLEAIPIDGVYDKKIYYDPIVIPAQGSVLRSTDYSYYMKSFENNLDEEGNKYSDLIKEKDFHFVHEVQHWLREQGDNGLKIYYYGY